jgi:hypothetical protein
MNTSYSYTREELLALRDKLKIALGEKESVIGRAEIATVGSVSKGKEKPNDIDLKVRIKNLFSDPTVLAAAKDAIRSVIKANCFDGPNPRILRKNNIWQWPLDIMISDGTWCLCLKHIFFKKPDVIEFDFFEQSNTTAGFPEITPSVPEPRKEEE